MIEEFKNIILAGLGSAAYSYEKATKSISDMVEKGKLTVNEGKELSEELKKNIKEKAEKAKDSVDERVKPLTKDDLKEVLNSMDYVSKKDLEELKERISKLEEKKI